MSKKHQAPTHHSGQARAARPVWLLSVFLVLGLAAVMPGKALADTCPDLQAYYPDEETSWFVLERTLARLMPLCLDSAEFFALYGAAQLNSGQLSAAIESLERALLTDPDHGAAQIDYAQALFLQGQLFPAMEMNRQVLQRPDLPDDLEAMLASRQQQWQRMTRRYDGELDIMLGHDSNLNRGPLTSQITVSLFGEPVELELSPEFLPVAGAYANLRAAASHTRFHPSYSHNWLLELNTRASEDADSDISQINARYVLVQPQRTHSWQIGGALTHLLVGGHRLFSAAESNLRYQVENDRVCAPYYDLAAQFQHYHGGSSLNNVETRQAGGLQCQQPETGTRVSAELGLLNSFAMEGDRPGGDRVGWQARFNWQYPLGRATMVVRADHTRLQDRKIYSELLANGARRGMIRNHLHLQYRRPSVLGGTLMVTLSHQRQRSNISLFSSDDTAAEFGMRFSF